MKLEEHEGIVHQEKKRYLKTDRKEAKGTRPT